jgi:HSP20 family protein
MDQQKLTVHENKSSRFKPASLWNVQSFWSQANLDPVIWSNDIFNSTRRNMTQMMEGFFDNWPAQKAHTTADVTEDHKSLRIRMDVPGLQADDIDISTEDGMLIISSDKQENDNGTISHYSFSYSTSLPEEALLEEADVRLENDRLSITIPKSDGEDSRNGPESRGQEPRNGHEPRRAANKTKQRKQKRVRR